ncbi:MAG: 16S rRNA (cytidine(1402)-2'-O)-methyltransferase [Sodaliphilus pleomorphus]|uniref:Ribosomal RNA small subunit methyltransferase I n=1 Tax=Sodaliphilus pleomorphus TaxID=2606626 RepID=A0A6L5XGY3_9BACT|nr:16S rRNA (cytidine(1402)-2'-O)-methyltransferase [Sodaliphilus pleomorphus]MCI6168983.1 16S rRNA (cytidine(1402)-2'-O)-methyltransferase [Muribaculaceae bacterium]MDY6258539.1 16S rRNA (cytidine(1402)-2'-O)-methyltransferase [Bacteroidales bacterium]MDD7065985.1 16S rRNA (cytidine(1402)-2'-O)-methyltransferase [Sodaliphilus pleomorphus]MDY2832545.1 16S rRNA (cytidine(1402)-2'-O)-methyltransferase [Sodaliphilus pleomorphus]MSS18700.1 16S rRNA (cytidine(1402)-2'-O)-methyltransferase [Sodaliph
MSGKLYIVPTPVGNLDDMTPRAINTLREAQLILAEDTRTSGVLMKHFGINTPMRSHHKFNEHETLPGLVHELQAGAVMALVTDAGTPGISDPGFLLVRECRRHDIEVETLPGATAFVPALVNSGLPCERFAFEGFLPPKKGRATRLAALASEQRTMIFYESPLRLAKTLKQLAEAFGPDRQASVSREISKLHNSTRNGTLEQLAQYYETNAPRGEIVLVVAGHEPQAAVKVDKYAKFKNKNNINNSTI